MSKALPRIKVRKAYLGWAWEVDNGRAGFYCKTWQEAIDLAMKWAYTGEHP